MSETQKWMIVRERSRDGIRSVLRSGYVCSAAAGAARAEIEHYTDTDDNLIITWDTSENRQSIEEDNARARTASGVRQE